MKNDNVKKTRYFVNTQHDFDAILEYAKQEGFITTRLEDDIKETFNIKNTNNVDAIVEQVDLCPYHYIVLMIYKAIPHLRFSDCI